MVQGAEKRLCCDEQQMTPCAELQDLLNHSQYQKNSKKCYWGTSTLILKNLKFPKVTKSLATSKKEVVKSCL